MSVLGMQVFVFDVGRGLCVAIQSPNGYLCLIDCGRSETYSPALALANHNWTEHRGHKLAYLIISHPHQDHLADIENITRFLPPAIILRRVDLDWRRVTSSGSDRNPEVQHFVRNYMPPEFTQNLTPIDLPRWGENFSICSYSLDEHLADLVSASDSQYVNNSSYVTVLRYLDMVLAFTGDTESAGMAALLRTNSGLRNELASGVDFFLTPHHGHPSGFSPEWFQIAGPTRILNIASERRRGINELASRTQIDPRYSQEQFCLGANRDRRRLVSTRRDGMLIISIDSDGTWSWEAISPSG